jgi:Malectin domain
MALPERSAPRGLDLLRSHDSPAQQESRIRHGKAVFADAGFTGGLTITNNPSGAVDTSLVTNPAPVSVYRSERYGTFTYTVSNLTADKSYTVNLHFTEDYWTAAGQRVFNVSINGSQVPSSFDIFAATGAQHKAIVKTFTAVADVNGKVAISFAPTTSCPDKNAKVDGVEVLAISSPTAKLTSNPTSVTSGQKSTLTCCKCDSDGHSAPKYAGRGLPICGWKLVSSRFRPSCFR